MFGFGSDFTLCQWKQSSIVFVKAETTPFHLKCPSSESKSINPYPSMFTDVVKKLSAGHVFHDHEEICWRAYHLVSANTSACFIKTGETLMNGSCLIPKPLNVSTVCLMHKGTERKTAKSRLSRDVRPLSHDYSIEKRVTGEYMSQSHEWLRVRVGCSSPSAGLFHIHQRLKPLVKSVFERIVYTSVAVIRGVPAQSLHICHNFQCDGGLTLRGGLKITRGLVERHFARRRERERERERKQARSKGKKHCTRGAKTHWWGFSQCGKCDVNLSWLVCVRSAFCEPHGHVRWRCSGGKQTATSTAKATKRPVELTFVTHSLMMCGCLNSFKFWISRLILPTTSRLRILCLFRIFTATLCPVNWCSPTKKKKKKDTKKDTRLRLPEVIYLLFIIIIYFS